MGKALELNNIKFTRAIDTNIDELQLNSTEGLSYVVDCGKGYDPAGICGPFRIDQTAGVTYSLNDHGSMSKNYHHDPETMFGNWTTGYMLFRGASHCAAGGGVAGLQAQMIMKTDGTVVIDSFNLAQVCTWDANSIDICHEYRNCPTQTRYIFEGCSGDANGCGNGDGSAAIKCAEWMRWGGILLGVSATDCICST